VTRVPIARQQLIKYIPAKAKALNNKTSIARKPISKYGSLTIEAVFSLVRALVTPPRIYPSADPLFNNLPVVPADHQMPTDYTLRTPALDSINQVQVRIKTRLVQQYNCLDVHFL
jgi:hypothetical protein